MFVIITPQQDDPPTLITKVWMKMTLKTKISLQRSGTRAQSMSLRRHLLSAALMLMTACAPIWGAQATDRLEPGLQGQAVPHDNPGSILARPYSKGVRVIGHDTIRGRD